MPDTVCHINLARGFRGGERQTELLVRELAAAGVTQTVVCRRGEPLGPRLAGLPGVELRPAAGNALAAYAAAGGCALVHAHETHGAHAAYLRKLTHGIPYVITRRVSNVPGNDFFTRRVYRNAAAIAAIAEAIAGTMRAYAPGVRVAVIRSATGKLLADPGRAAEIRERYRGRFLVGQVGALDEKTKGQSYVIEAARRLADLPDLAVLFVGSGRDEAMLKARAEGLSSVVFTGFVDNVGDWLSALDVLILPSMNEGLGSILLDAMQFGLPVVGSRVGGIPEIVHHEVNGLLVEPRDVEGLAAAIRRLHGDPALRVRLGSAGRAFVSDLTPKRMAAGYRALYGDILGARPGGGVA